MCNTQSYRGLNSFKKIQTTYTGLLEVKRKEINEYLNNKDAYENSLPSNPGSR